LKSLRYDARSEKHQFMIFSIFFTVLYVL